MNKKKSYLSLPDEPIDLENITKEEAISLEKVVSGLYDNLESTAPTDDNPDTESSSLARKIVSGTLAEMQRAINEKLETN